MRFSLLVGLAGVSSLATAALNLTPRPLEKRTNCKEINLALTVLKQLGPPATSFCSSYLKVPATTTVSVTTTSTKTIPTSTTTVTVTSPVCPAPQRRSPGQLLADRNSAPKITPAADDLIKRLNLPALSAFAAAKLSSGCSCLGLAPKTSITATVTARTSTIKVVATSTTCTVSLGCTPPGGPCDLPNPGACCGLTCINDVVQPFCA